MLKKSLTLMAIAIISIATFAQTTTHSHGTSAAGDNTSVAACALNAWSPEIFTFYGDSSTILEKMATINRNLDTHRTFAFVIETKAGATLFFFEGEKLSSKVMSLGTINGNSFSEFTQSVTNGLLTNNGDDCAGMLTKNLLMSQFGDQMTYSNINKPTTMKAAYDLISQSGDAYVRATFILLC